MTGYKESEGKIDYSEIYWEFISAMSKRMDVNKSKYEKHNYRKPLDKDQLLQAALRHLIKVIEPQDHDSETAEEHVASIACNMMMYYYQIKNHAEQTKIFT